MGPRGDRQVAEAVRVGRVAEDVLPGHGDLIIVMAEHRPHFGVAFVPRLVSSVGLAELVDDELGEAHRAGGVVGLIVFEVEFENGLMGFDGARQAGEIRSDVEVSGAGLDGGEFEGDLWVIAQLVLDHVDELALVGERFVDQRGGDLDLVLEGAESLGFQADVE